MFAAFLFVAMAATPDSTEFYFARNDVASLEAWCAGRDAEPDLLQCRYRLFPLTRDQALLRDLPDDPASASARTLALLSGLWGFRAAEAGFPGVIRHGRRAQRLLDRARDLDPEDPFVLLVEGQSLLFKPRMFGGSAEEAERRFDRLAAVLDRSADPPMYRQEALVWRWFALVRRDDQAADDVRRRLLADDPLPVFRLMLENPPS